MVLLRKDVPSIIILMLLLATILVCALFGTAIPTYSFINPRRMCESYRSRCVCVCYCTNCYILHLHVKNKVPLGFLRRFQDMHYVSFVENTLFKSFGDITDHFCLLHFLTTSQWTKETVMASFHED